MGAAKVVCRGVGRARLLLSRSASSARQEPRPPGSPIASIPRQFMNHALPRPVFWFRHQTGAHRILQGVIPLLHIHSLTTHPNVPMIGEPPMFWHLVTLGKLRLPILDPIVILDG